MGNLFVEPELFAALAAWVGSSLADDGWGGQQRAWVAGCGTGEDAYAAALLLHEAAARAALAPAFTVFATDTDGEHLATARAGVYPSARLADLAPGLRERFFFPSGALQHVRATLREQVIFAIHRLLEDPPFSRLDLIICREQFCALLPVERARALERFAFALRPGALLLPGDALPVDSVAPHFRCLDEALHLYARTAAPLHPPELGAGGAPPLAEPPPGQRQGLAGVAEDARMPALVVDDLLRIVYLGQGVAPFLRLIPGTPSYQLMEVVLPELRSALSATVARARVRSRAAESLPIPASIAGEARLVTIIVQPIGAGVADASELLVLFDSVEAPPPAEDSAASDRPIDLLMLQEQHNIVYEELRVANEELRILNEELLTSTEELETRREELQTLNEQLQLINREQQQTLVALGRANADLENLIASTEVGTIFLDRDLRVKRFTTPARQVFHLLPADLGRPLDHLAHELEYDALLPDAMRALRELTPYEREARHHDGRWFLVRLRPYRSGAGQITGIVLTFVDISERKWAEEVLRESHAELERRVAERTAELVQANAARQALLRELVQAQEAERLRIARELHDTLGQQITAILLGLQALKEHATGDAAPLRQFEQVREIVQTMGRELHEIALTLRPTALDDVGLAGALRGHVEGWSRRTGIAAELFITGIEHRGLAPEIETTLYRVVQEALTNVARHAGARRVSVVLESDGSRVVAAVEDDGRGFDSEAAIAGPGERTHLGLLGMRERAALVGGTLVIESEPGGGTTVIARIPLATPFAASG